MNEHPTPSAVPPRGRRFRGIAADERRRQRREQLLDAGLRLFGAQGYHAIGVREVCAEARLTERYFYESFRNREALFVGVYDAALEKTQSAVVAAVMGADEDPRAMARAGQRAFLECLREDPNLARVLFVEALSVSAEVSRHAQAAMQGFSQIVALLLLRVYPTLGTHGADPALVADGLIGSTVHIVMRWAAGNFELPIDVILEHCVLFYDALIADAERRLRVETQTPTVPSR